MSLNILVINENAEFCTSLSTLLAADGHSVSCVKGIRETINAVHQRKPELVILEVATEKIAALEIKRRLMRLDETRHIPLIVISEHPELEYELLKVFDFIPQPVNMIRLREDIEILEKGGEERTLPLRFEPLSDSYYQMFRDYLVTFSGLNFERRNIKALERGLASRMTALKIGSYLDYFDYLIQHRESRQEMQKLLQFLTIGETYFFRYPSQFAALRKVVATELASKKNKRLRIWSAGCSTGEEPYSLAMTVISSLPDWRKWDIRILGTDINDRSLRRAREGTYGSWSMRGMEQGHLDRFFTKVGEKYAVSQEVRNLVDFSHLNLQTDEFPTRDGACRDLDVIFCRNVMIYFAQETTKQIVDRLTDCLNPGGYLFLGHSETLAQISSRFDRHSQEGGFYYRKKSGSSLPQRHGPKPAPAAKPAKLPVAGVAAHQGRAVPESQPGQPAPAAVKEAPRAAIDVEALYRKAQIQFDAENFSEASRLLHEVTGEEPDHVGALVLQGFIAANRGLYEEALAVCDLVLGLNDLRPEVYFLKGLVLEMMDKPTNAVEEYRKAILLQMDFVMPRHNLGRLLFRLGKEKDGVRELRNCMKILLKLRTESLVPYSGGVTREVFLDQLHNELENVV
jgi:chemotaxis protein methyltransferase CheR